MFENKKFDLTVRAYNMYQHSELVLAQFPIKLEAKYIFQRLNNDMLNPNSTWPLYFYSPDTKHTTFMSKKHDDALKNLGAWYNQHQCLVDKQEKFTTDGAKRENHVQLRIGQMIIATVDDTASAINDNLNKQWPSTLSSGESPAGIFIFIFIFISIISFMTFVCFRYAAGAS